MHARVHFSCRGTTCTYFSCRGTTARWWIQVAVHKRLNNPVQVKGLPLAGPKGLLWKTSTGCMSWSNQCSSTDRDVQICEYSYICLHQSIVNGEEGLHWHTHFTEGFLNKLNRPSQPTVLHLKKLDQVSYKDVVGIRGPMSTCIVRCVSCVCAVSCVYMCVCVRARVRACVCVCVCACFW